MLLLPGGAHAAGQRCVDAATISAAMRAGRPVSKPPGTDVCGTLAFPLDVRAPVLLDHVTFHGPVRAASSAFDRLVSMRQSTFDHGAVFTGATFAGPSVFAGSTVWGPTRFDDATFRGAPHFGNSHFQGPVTFEGAEFDAPTRFRGSIFAHDASFGSAAFRDVADFTGAQFQGRAGFQATDFGSDADFTSGIFSRRVSFLGARFRAGANFLNAEFDHAAAFDGVSAPADLVFSGAELDGRTTFLTARLLGEMVFAGAKVYRLLDLHEAEVRDLNLDGATLEPNASVVLPSPRDALGGSIDALRLDPNDVGHVGTEGSADEKATRRDRERALALIQAAAQRGGDTRAANHAYYLRESLVRHDEIVVLRVPNYIFLWAGAGYFVAPLHQVILILVLLVTFAWIRSRRSEPHRFRAGLRETWSSLWRLDIRKGTAWQSAEATAYKLVLVVLLLNLANVWPPVHDVLKGVLL